MKNILILSVLAATMAAPAFAQQSSELRTRNDRLEATEGASKLTWRGDLRYRHEMIDPEEAARDQSRQRIRARIGLQAKITETLAATVQLATDGGNGDPRSTNQTLGDGLSRKGVAIDLAYVDWKPASGLSVQLGKIPYAWQRVGSYFWDGDITWEGGAIKYERGPLFASATDSWLQEAAAGPDATLIGGQLGLKGQVGGVKLLGALGYFDVGAVQNQITTTATGCTANAAFFGGPQGNTTIGTSGCARLLNDFDMMEAIVQADFTVGRFPLALFADFIRNRDADDLDTGYAAGLTFGRASAPRSWELGYTYQDAGKDSQFGQFHDSDFGGGLTDTRGSAFRIGYAPARGWLLNGTYFVNERFVDAGTPRDYDRLQLDLNYRF